MYIYGKWHGNGVNYKAEQVTWVLQIANFQLDFLIATLVIFWFVVTSYTRFAPVITALR